MTGTGIARKLATGALLAATALTLLAGTQRAEARPEAVFTSASYAFTPSVSVPEGSTALYLNLDPTLHAVVSQAADPSTGKPLFRSQPAGAGEIVEVIGVQHLTPGTYGFFCSLHPGMKGELVVADLNVGQ